MTFVPKYGLIRQISAGHYKILTRFTFMDNKQISSLTAAILLCGGLTVAQRASAAVVPLAHGGSSLTVDVDSAAGMNSWFVDTAPSQNQLNKQWFY